MARHIQVTYTLPYKGEIETRTIRLFRDTNKDTKESFELDLREDIGEPNLVVTDFKSYNESEWVKVNNLVI